MAVEERSEELQTETVAAEGTKLETTDGAGDSSPQGDEQPGSGEQVDLLTKYQTLLEENSKKDAEISDLKDQYLRKQADFENFRKRMFREKEEAAKFGISSLLQDIIPVIDDFERAIKSSEDSKDFDAFHSGIQMIERQLVGLLERKWGLLRFDSVGEPFDPQRHEAIAMEDRADHTESLVLEEFQRGFLLHERVVRPSKVKVSRPLAEAAAQAGDEGEESV